MTNNEDIIVVIAGCKIPVVLRRYENKYLFVGGCWLIESHRLLEAEAGKAGSRKDSPRSCTGVC